MERRTFMRYMGTLGTTALLFPELMGCEPKSKMIPLKMLGASESRGHVLRNMHSLRQRRVDEERNIKHLIVGAGISGLSTAYHLNKKEEKDVVLFDLEDEVGGNSGTDATGGFSFPLGAHYLSLPNPSNTELADFLKEEGLITGTKNGKWMFNERHLCHSPDERLWIKGTFQDGLVPSYGLQAKEEAAIATFFQDMERWKLRKTALGEEQFSIPNRLPSDENDERWKLDAQPFSEWLKANNYTNEELLWFLDYCCRDDFGAGLTTVSAWAGLHYFAGRKANPANAKSSAVMTWSEGNGFLVNRLKTRIEATFKTAHLVLKVEENPDGVEALVYDIQTDKLIRYKGKSLTLACQSFVTARLLNDASFSELSNQLIHYPWMVSAVVLKDFPHSQNGTPLAWDNVKYGEKQLGYINNRHQELSRVEEPHVMSVYSTFDQFSSQEARQKLFRLSEDDMRKMVIEEMEKFHPDCAQYMQQILVQRWGHGMLTPTCGTLKILQELNNHTKNNYKRISFAHTDYAGYSIFEEAFNQGRQASENGILC